MSDYDEKPIDPKVRRLAARIMKLQMRYNPTSTKRELTGNKPTFDIEYSGIHAMLFVTVYPKGYIKNYPIDEIFSKWISLNTGKSERIIQDLNHVLMYMKKVYADWYQKEKGENEDKQN